MAQAAPEKSRTANVLIMGTTGAGKSTLANLLVFGEESLETGGYAVGDDPESLTTECACHSRHQQTYTLQVTDTPGVPDTNPAKSLVNYDKIIEYVRRAPWLNAIIIMVEGKRMMEKEYGDMRALMHQFDMLPCAKIMVCRVQLPQRCSDRRKQEKDAAAMRLMDKICEKAGLSYVHRYILHHMDDEDVISLREIVSAMPIVSMADQKLRTFEEIKAAFERLSNAETRMSALEDELKALRTQRETNESLVQKLAVDLQRELDNQQAIDQGIAAGGLVGQVVADVVAWEAAGLAGGAVQLASLGVRAITKTALAHIPQRLRSEKQKAAARLDEQSKEIEQKEGELRRGQVDPGELQRARTAYVKLRTLSCP